MSSFHFHTRLTSSYRSAIVGWWLIAMKSSVMKYGNWMRIFRTRFKHRMRCVEASKSIMLHTKMFISQKRLSFRSMLTNRNIIELLSDVLIHWLSFILREKNDCNCHNVTIIYHFLCQLYIYRCFNHANYNCFNCTIITIMIRIQLYRDCFLIFFYTFF